MTFQFTQSEEEFEYNPEEECVVHIEMVHAAPFQMHYEAWCSECDDEIDVMKSPRKCPSCERDIIDWRDV